MDHVIALDMTVSRSQMTFCHTENILEALVSVKARGMSEVIADRKDQLEIFPPLPLKQIFEHTINNQISVSAEDISLF